MKKIIIGAFAIIAVSAAFIFAGCEKEDCTNIQSALARTDFISYDGTPFSFDNNFVNPYAEYGLLHNDLVKNIMVQWYSNIIPIDDFPSIVEFTINSAEQMTGFDVDDKFLVKKMIESFLPDTSKSYIESLRATLRNDTDFEQISSFIEDIEFITYEKEMVDDEQLEKIKVAEQKIFHSEINEDLKNVCLIFCAVYSASYYNLMEMTSDPENNLCYAKKVTGDLVIADACGAAKGAYDGYKVGKFAGPQATAAMVTLGAVTYGALSTAVEAGITQNAAKLIDKGLDGLRNKFKISL